MKSSLILLIGALFLQTGWQLQVAAQSQGPDAVVDIKPGSQDNQIVLVVRNEDEPGGETMRRVRCRLLSKPDMITNLQILPSRSVVVRPGVVKEFSIWFDVDASARETGKPLFLVFQIGDEKKAFHPQAWRPTVQLLLQKESEEEPEVEEQDNIPATQTLYLGYVSFEGDYMELASAEERAESPHDDDNTVTKKFEINRVKNLGMKIASYGLDIRYIHPKTKSVSNYRRTNDDVSIVDETILEGELALSLPGVITLGKDFIMGASFNPKIRYNLHALPMNDRSHPSNEDYDTGKKNIIDLSFTLAPLYSSGLNDAFEKKVTLVHGKEYKGTEGPNMNLTIQYIPAKDRKPTDQWTQYGDFYNYPYTYKILEGKGEPWEYAPFDISWQYESPGEIEEDPYIKQRVMNTYQVSGSMAFRGGHHANVSANISWKAFYYGTDSPPMRISAYNARSAPYAGPEALEADRQTVIAEARDSSIEASPNEPGENNNTVEPPVPEVKPPTVVKPPAYGDEPPTPVGTRPGVNPPGRRNDPSVSPESADDILNGPNPWQHPRVQALMNEWLRIAAPNLKPVPGGRWRYTNWGVAYNGVTIKNPSRSPSVGKPRYQWLWERSKRLNSTAHSTLRIYIERGLRNQPLDQVEVKPPQIVISDPVQKHRFVGTWKGGVEYHLWKGSQNPKINKLEQKIGDIIAYSRIKIEIRKQDTAYLLYSFQSINQDKSNLPKEYMTYLNMLHHVASYGINGRDRLKPSGDNKIGLTILNEFQAKKKASISNLELPLAMILPAVKQKRDTLLSIRKKQTMVFESISADKLKFTHIVFIKENWLKNKKTFMRPFYKYEVILQRVKAK